MPPAQPLTSPTDREAARGLVGGTCLKWEPGFDDLVGIFEAGQLVACGARAGRVLKMLVVNPAWRGQGLLGEVVVELMRLGRAAGVDGFFIFTRPETAPSFTGLGFKPLVTTGRAVLLEHGNGLHHYLRRRGALIRSGGNAGVVINADPLTNGHIYLVEQAARAADWVYVFVASEGCFVWPLDARLDMVRRGTAHLGNVLVTDSGPYSLASPTFPAYFLRDGESADEIRLEVDAQLFATHLAPAFNLRLRAVGSEPLDPVLREYNRIVRQALENHGIRLLEVERLKRGEQWISTALIQRALCSGDESTLHQCVPPPVLDYLASTEARACIETLRRAGRGIAEERI